MTVRDGSIPKLPLVSPRVGSFLEFGVMYRHGAMANRGISINRKTAAYRELNTEPRRAVRPVKARLVTGGPHCRLALDQEQPLG